MDLRAATSKPRARRREASALILRRFPYGESSLVVHALSPGLGRLALLAKGAYRPSSGFFGVLDLFDTLELVWSERPQAELGLVTGAALSVRRRNLSADLARYRAGLSVLELAALAAREGHEEQELFRWLVEALDLLERAGSDPELVLIAFDLAFLRNAGLTPALERCATYAVRPAGRALRAAFSAALGGRLCPPCASEARARGRTIEVIPLNLLRVASSLMEATPDMLERTRIDSPLKTRVRGFVERFLRYHLESGLRSRGSPARGRPRGR